MGTYGKTKEEAIARINSYKNPDKRCTYPFTCDPLGYCWSYAHHMDGTVGFEDIEAKCKSCEYWKDSEAYQIRKHYDELSEKYCSLQAELQQVKEELDRHRWIPVSERLPEKTEEDLRPQVLVFDGESVTGALWRHYSFGWDFETDRGKPTHWKPIILPKDKPDAK